METKQIENMETKTKSDFEFIEGVREYIEYEEVIRFKYKGKLYERVLVDNSRRDEECSLYLRDIDGDVDDDDLLDKCGEWFWEDESLYKRIKEEY
jgi:hypothetical protein